MTLKVIAAATELPVSLSSAKVQCRIVDGDTTHDTRLTELIWRAAASIESITGTRLSSQTVEYLVDGFPRGDIRLPVYPVTAISSVKYDDSDGVEQTLSSDAYWEAIDGRDPKVRVIDLWPGTLTNKPDSVRVRFVCGFTEATLPNDLKLAVLLRVGELFERSTESSVGQEVFSTVNTVAGLVYPHKKAYV